MTEMRLALLPEKMEYPHFITSSVRPSSAMGRDPMALAGLRPAPRGIQRAQVQEGADQAFHSCALKRAAALRHFDEAPNFACPRAPPPAQFSRRQP